MRPPRNCRLSRALSTAWRSETQNMMRLHGYITKSACDPARGHPNKISALRLRKLRSLKRDKRPRGADEENAESCFQEAPPPQRPDQKPWHTDSPIEIAASPNRGRRRSYRGTTLMRKQYVRAKSRSLALRSFQLSLLASVLAPMPALAQTEIETVTVTAQRREELAQKVRSRSTC